MIVLILCNIYAIIDSFFSSLQEADKTLLTGDKRTNLLHIPRTHRKGTMETFLAWLGVVLFVAVYIAGLGLLIAACVDFFRKQWRPSKRDAISTVGFLVLAVLYWIATTFSPQNYSYAFFARLYTAGFILFGISSLGWRYLERKFGVRGIRYIQSRWTQRKSPTTP